MKGKANANWNAGFIFYFYLRGDLYMQWWKMQPVVSQGF